MAGTLRVELDVREAADGAEAEAEVVADLPAERRVEVDDPQRGLGAQEAAGELVGVVPLGGQAERRLDAEAELPAAR